MRGRVWAVGSAQAREGREEREWSWPQRQQQPSSVEDSHDDCPAAYAPRSPRHGLAHRWRSLLAGARLAHVLAQDDESGQGIHCLLRRRAARAPAREPPRTRGPGPFVRMTAAAALVSRGEVQTDGCRPAATIDCWTPNLPGGVPMGDERAKLGEMCATRAALA